MSAIFQLIFLPVTLLNLLGGIVGYLWLAFTGQWYLVILGLGLATMTSWIMGVALAPGLLFSGPGVVLLEKNRRALGSLLVLLGEAWTYVVMFVWCYFIFQEAMKAWDGTHSIYPYLLWFYATATAPFTYAAATAPERSVGSFVAALASCVGCIITMVLVLLGMATAEAVAVALIAPMCVALLMQALMVREVARHEF